MKSLRATLLACTGLFAVTSYPGVAAVDDYAVEPGQRLHINLDVCSSESQLAVRGDTGTDLDFQVSGPNGEALLSDEGIDDYISLVLENEGEGCAQFDLYVSNLGEEKNDLTVVLTPVVEGSTRVKKFIVQGETTEKHSFKACGTSARVSARGDGDTDLDFIIRNSDGGIVHEDDGTSDETSAQLAGLLSDCETFELEVTNLGAVYNAMMLVIEPEGYDPAEFSGTAPTTALVGTSAAGGPGNSAQIATVEADGSGPGEYNAAANTRLVLDLTVCGTRRLEVRGSGVSDLDFAVSNASGDEVHSDVDLSDVTFKTLEAPAQCETYSLAVSNIGDTDNSFEVALIDPATRVGDIGAGDYLIRGNTSTKVALQVCGETRISARGGGGTDLDFDVTDGAGSSVHSDYDMTDATEFTLDPNGACKDYQISVSNLGESGNTLTVAFGDDAGTVQRKQEGPFVAGPTRPTSGIARPGQIVGFRKGLEGSAEAMNRKISLFNNTGEALVSLYWSNSATIGWGEDRLGSSSLARDQQWNVEVTDGSAACLFDFRAVTQTDREIEVGQVNVCETGTIAFE